MHMHTHAIINSIFGYATGRGTGIKKGKEEGHGEIGENRNGRNYIPSDSQASDRSTASVQSLTSFVSTWLFTPAAVSICV